MKPYQSALVVFLGTAMAALPSVAQQAPSTQILANETCAGCFAYLEFSPPLEPESDAMRGQAPNTSASLPPASEPSELSREQALLLPSKQ